MAEDQSVVGRRRIYYDQKGGEALIASDSEEEAIEDDDSKKEFRESEDYVLRLVYEMGPNRCPFASYPFFMLKIWVCCLIDIQLKLIAHFLLVLWTR